MREPSGRLPNMLKEVLAVHQTQLEQFVLDLASSNLSQDFVVSTPVCSYYSPELQLHIPYFDFCRINTNLFAVLLLNLVHGVGGFLSRFLSDN